MARIRTIKPEFWTDEKLAVLDTTTRLVYLGLISLADDYGRLVDNLKALDGQIFPFTDESCADALETLATLQRIVRYTAKSGQNLIQIVRWSDHQKVNHPGKEIWPAPTAEDLIKPAVTRPSSNPPEKRKRVKRESLASYQRPTTSTNDLRPTTVSDSGESGKVPWVAEGSDWWAANVGSISPPRFGKALSDAVKLHTWAKVFPALKCYAEDAKTKGKAPKPEWFAGDAVRWVEWAGMPATDENGDLTPRGKAILGVA